MATAISPRQRLAENTISEVARSTISWRSKAPSKNRCGPGKIDISTSMSTIFAKCLRPVKTLCAHSGRRSTIASIINWCGCVYGKQPTIGLRCEDCSGGLRPPTVLISALIDGSYSINYETLLDHRRESRDRSRYCDIVGGYRRRPDCARLCYD